MPRPGPVAITLEHLDGPTRRLVRVAAVLAGGTEDDIRQELQPAAGDTPREWIEEVLLQTYLFAGFPRALNGMREWRRIVPVPASADVVGASRDRLVAAGEATCASVYGSMYERLRGNIRHLHPLLDEWMIVEGYGKVLSREQLDLPRRELCIVAACAATGQDRQLQSHLHGARNVGVANGAITDALMALRDRIHEQLHTRATRLWDRIRHDIH